MSLNCICTICEERAGWYAGAKDGTQETDNLYIIGKLEGDQGVTYDNTEKSCAYYICGDCLEKALPEIKKSIDDESGKTAKETALSKLNTEDKTALGIK